MAVHQGLSAAPQKRRLRWKQLGQKRRRNPNREESSPTAIASVLKAGLVAAAAAAVGGRVTLVPE